MSFFDEDGCFFDEDGFDEDCVSAKQKEEEKAKKQKLERQKEEEKAKKKRMLSQWYYEKRFIHEW
jgi:hypothetical protein